MAIGSLERFRVNRPISCLNLLIAIKLRLYRNSLDFFHRKEKNVCDQCGEKFNNYEDLINHAKHLHHHQIVKCHDCGKEFIHEKDRLHHVREEHERKIESREEKNLYRHEKSKPVPPQADVDEHTKNFSDNFGT
jgi:DNA-directed RNA polymerase subunit RPC12/RpoP